jgi:hypothetical protein
VSRTYKLLAEYYNDNGESDKIQNLLDTASALRSANKDFIVHMLQNSCQ